MKDHENEDWNNEENADQESDLDMSAIMSMLKQIEKRSKNTMNYFIKEGFIEVTEDPNVYKYTPEGLVLLQEKYKQIQKNGGFFPL